MSFIKGIYDICDQYTNGSWYVGEVIPEKKLRNVIDEFPIPPEEEIIAVVDCTIFGSCKIGLAICSGGLFLNNDWTGKVRKGYLTWYDFIQAEIRADGKYNVEVTPTFIIGMSGSLLKPDELIKILEHIQGYATKALREGILEEQPMVDLSTIVPNLSADSMWMLGIEGEKYGPYTTEIVKDMIKGGQVVPDHTYVWKEGMAQWEILSSIPDFVQGHTTMPPLPTVHKRESSALNENENISDLGQEHPIINNNEQIELNNASLQELLLLPGIDLKTAQNFIEERTARNGFGDFNEVRASLNLQPHFFDQILKRTTLKPLSTIKGSGRVIDF